MTMNSRSEPVNRQTRRMAGRRGGAAAAGAAGVEDPLVADAAAAVVERADRTRQQRTSPVQFAREIRDELRQVAWPSRAEMVNYSTVVLVTLVLMIALIFLLNYAFGKGVLFMFQR